MQNNTTPTPDNTEKINLREVLLKYSYHWKTFLIGIIIAVTLAFLYLRFATYEYQVSSTVLINDEDNDGGTTSEISVFQDLGLFSGPKTSLDTEIGILKSKSLIERVVKELRLNISYHTKNGLGRKEVYGKEVPYNINLFVNENQLKNLDTLFTIKATSTTEFALISSHGDEINLGRFGEKISCKFGDLIATPNYINNVAAGEELTIQITPLERVSLNLKKRIEVTPDNVKSNLLILKLQDPIKEKAKDILDNLVTYYNKEAIEYKKRVAKNTDKFLTNRIDDISIELTRSDQGVQTYKTNNSLSNLDSESSLALASNAQLSNRIVELNSQIKLIDYVTEYMNANQSSLIPSNLGLLNENTSQNTINYNNLVLERNRLLTSANNENPVVENLNNQISGLRESIDRSLINTRSSLQIALGDARRQENKLNSKISSSPKKEREIRDIQRQQEIYETLYQYLLQKKEENSISLAVTAPTAKIIDKAYGSHVPIAPRRLIVLLGSIILGFLIPLIYLISRSLFDNKIHTHEELEQIIQLPVLANIPAISSDEEYLVFKDNKNKAAESFRLLRTLTNQSLQKISLLYNEAHTTNLTVRSATDNISFEPDFNTTKKENLNSITKTANEKKAKLIFVSSTLRKEGKTFVAINLAKSYALLNKKVLLIEADLRNPMIHKYLNSNNSKGLAHILESQKTKISDVIATDKTSSLDLLVAGSSPDFPSELLANGRFEEVLNYAKKNYDYVIIDTPAVNVVTDTLLISQYADLFIYVIRANYLSEKTLQIPKNMYKNNHLPNIKIVLNATDYKRRGYDNNYDFG